MWYEGTINTPSQDQDMGFQPGDDVYIQEALEHMRSLFAESATAELEGRFDDAERLLRERIRLAPWDPIAKYALSQLLLSRGEYEEGFRLYEARSSVPQFMNLVQKPIYNP
jgi:hypothetical protein